MFSSVLFFFIGGNPHSAERNQYTTKSEIGIAIFPEEQKKGYAKEVLKAILGFLFSIKDFHQVVKTTDAENAASIQLFKSIGLRQEGHFIENIFFKDDWEANLNMLC